MPAPKYLAVGMESRLQPVPVPSRSRKAGVPQQTEANAAYSRINFDVLDAQPGGAFRRHDRSRRVVPKSVVVPRVREGIGPAHDVVVERSWVMTLRGLLVCARRLERLVLLDLATERGVVALSFRRLPILAQGAALR